MPRRSKRGGGSTPPPRPGPTDPGSCLGATVCDHSASTIDHSETTVVFEPGNYTGTDLTWRRADHAPSARVCLAAFRAIFDAVGDETIDTTGDIDPGILLRILDRGPKRTGQATAWLRLACQWARRRSMRVGFSTDGSVTALPN